MSILWIIICVALLFVSLMNLTGRLSRSKYEEKYKSEIKRNIKYMAAWGSLNIMLSILLAFIYKDNYSFDMPIKSIFLIFNILTTLANLILWGGAPNDSSISRQEQIDIINREISNYSFDKTFSWSIYSFSIDTGKEVVLYKMMLVNNYIIIPFKNIIDVEILEDNSSIMKGGIARAVVGGIIAGGIGAIVGAGTRSSKDVVNSLQVRIITSDITNPMRMIDVIKGGLDRNSKEYANAMDFAQNVYSTVYSIIANNKSKKDDPDIM